MKRYVLGEIGIESCPNSRINEKKKNLLYHKIGLKLGRSKVLDSLKCHKKVFLDSPLASVPFIAEEHLKMKLFSARLHRIKPGEVRFLDFRFKMNELV